MNAVKIKLALAAVLFGAWVALVVFKTPDVADLISYIKVALGGLGIYHALMTNPAPVAPSTDTTKADTPQ